jgi:hypothetical protein
MSFQSNPPRKLAIAATIGGAAYLGTPVSLSATVSRQSVKRIDAITSFFSLSQKHAITSTRSRRLL